MRLYFSGDLPVALDRWSCAKEIIQRLDPNSLAIASVMGNIGLVLEKQGKMNDALEQYKRVLEIQTRLAPNSLDVANTRSNIGTLFADKGNLRSALDHLQRALNIKKHLEPNSLTVATAYQNIGVVRQRQGDWKGALEQYQHALEIREQLAPDSLELATSYNGIGTILASQGDSTRSLKLFQLALEIQNRLAPESLDVAGSCNNIGVALRSGGDLKIETAILAKAAMITQGLKSDSLDAATIFTNYAIVLAEKDDLGDALKMFKEALLIQERRDRLSFDTAFLYICIGAIYKRQDEVEDACTAFRKALEIEQDLSNTDPSESATVLRSLNAVQAIRMLIEGRNMIYGIDDHRDIEDILRTGSDEAVLEVLSSLGLSQDQVDRVLESVIASTQRSSELVRSQTIFREARKNCEERIEMIDLFCVHVPHRGSAELEMSASRLKVKSRGFLIGGLGWNGNRTETHDISDKFERLHCCHKFVGTFRFTVNKKSKKIKSKDLDGIEHITSCDNEWCGLGEARDVDYLRRNMAFSTDATSRTMTLQKDFNQNISIAMNGNVSAGGPIVRGGFDMSISLLGVKTKKDEGLSITYTFPSGYTHYALPLKDNPDIMPKWCSVKKT